LEGLKSGMDPYPERPGPKYPLYIATPDIRVILENKILWNSHYQLL